MKIITINCPEKFISLCDKLVQLGIYPSRSEIFRAMLNEFFDRKLAMIDNIDKLIEQADKLLDYNKKASKVGQLPNLRPSDFDVSILNSEEIVKNPDGSRTRVREYFRGDVEIVDDEEYVSVPKPIHQKSINEM